MLKIIKWSVTFCITVVLLIGETAQAMPPPKKKKRVTTPNKPITTRSVTIHQKAAASAYGNEPSIQERVVAKVDPLAQKLDYSDFNWGMLYPFYNESMSNVAFLKATQHEGYDNIPAITQALSESEDYPQATTAEIKFDIYLSLATLRGLCAKHRWYNLNGYKNVIKKIFNAGFRKTRIDYPKTEPVDMSKFHTELQYFIYDPGVQSIRLNNTALELVSVINEYVHPKNNDVDQKLALLGTQNFTFAQLLQYYPDEEEDIFVFLVSYPLETAKFEGPDGSIKYLRTETELKYKTAQFFNKLWDTSHNYEHLAKLANTAFKYNPLAYAAQTLKKNLTSPETRSVFTHSKSTEIPVSSTISEKIYDVLISHSEAIISAFPIDDDEFKSALTDNKIIDFDELQEIEAHTTKENKSRQLMDIMKRKLLMRNEKKFIHFLKFIKNFQFKRLSLRAEKLYQALKTEGIIINLSS